MFNALKDAIGHARRRLHFPDPEIEAAYLTATRVTSRWMIRTIGIAAFLLQLTTLAQPGFYDAIRTDGIAAVAVFTALLSGFIGCAMLWRADSRAMVGTGTVMGFLVSFCCWTIAVGAMDENRTQVLADTYLTQIIPAGLLMCVARREALATLALCFVIMAAATAMWAGIGWAEKAMLLRLFIVATVGWSMGLVFDAFSRSFFHVGQRLRTEKERATTNAMHALNASQSKTQFLAVMSHELRTPLNAIMGFSQMIKGEYLGPVGNARYTDYAKDIEDAGQHLLKVIDNVLEYSRFEIGKVKLEAEPVSVPGYCESLARLASEHARRGETTLYYAFDPRAAAAEFAIDPTRMRQALLNLVSNAVKFSPAGSVITLEVSVTEDHGIALSVADNGPGMTQEQAQSAVQAFAQVADAKARGAEGLGIGLALTKHVAEGHGAGFEIETAPGAGCRVTITLPPDTVSLFAMLGGTRAA